jgi:hypothetical protein
MPISKSSRDVADKTVSEDTKATFAGGASLRRLASLSGWLRSALFRPTAAGPLGWRKFLAGVAFVVVGAAVSLARTRGPGALNTIWIEDARVFLDQALHESVMNTITTQWDGYYNVLPRAFTAVAVLFPLRWAPAVMSSFAAMQYALFGLIAYIASGPHLRSRWLRLLIAVPACMIPLGYTEANNDLATVQFVALYGTFWLLLWIPGTRAGRLISPVIILGVTLTSILPVVFAPLALARLIADRSKNTIFLLSFYVVGLATQYSVQLRGLSNRPTGWFTSPLWVLEKYISRVVPRALFGEKALGGGGTNINGMPVSLHITSQALHLALIGAAWLVVAAVILIAFARITEPHWPLAITAGLFSVLIFLGEIVNNLQIVQPRYVIAPALLLYLAIIALLRPRGVMPVPAAGGEADTGGLPDRAPERRVATVDRVAAWYPVAVFAALLALACALNFRVTNARSQSPAWSTVVANAQASCDRPGVTGYVYKHDWWTVDIPCSRLSRPPGR